MNQIEKSNRRVEVSSEISDYVYEFEKDYTKRNPQNPLATTEQLIKQSYGKSIKIVDSMYDEKSGVAAIAVEDTLTGETYIAYAGTDYEADGHKDIIVDTVFF